MQAALTVVHERYVQQWRFFYYEAMLELGKDILWESVKEVCLSLAPVYCVH